MAPYASNADEDRRNPPIPSYDEALASHPSYGDGPLPSPSQFGPLSPMGEAYYAPEHESTSLLRRSHQRSASTATDPGHAGSGARARAAMATTRPGGYRPPTVETDDEDSTWSSSDEEGGGGREGEGGTHTEAAQVRREMHELEMEDPLHDSSGRSSSSRSSIFGKSIGFTLPKWRWRWRWRWSMPKLRIRLGGEAAAAAEGTEGAAGTERARRRCVPRPPAASTAVTMVVMGRILAVAIVLGVVYLLFMSDLFSSLSRRLGSQMFDPESVRIHLQTSVNNDNMRALAQHFTGYAHMAGTEGDFALAVDVKNLFVQYGLEDVSVDEYYVYLNYPTKEGRAVQLLGADGAATWTAQLEEDEVGGETAGHQTYAFHGLSKAGDVRGPLVYANFGSRADFQKLADSGIETRGAIALVRYYGTQADRALKVKAAELAGFAGCLIYSDPAEDGFVQGEAAPNGRFMPADGVQRGSVSLMGWVIGDVLTPGWESKKGLPRLTPENSPGLVQIPSLPLAWRDAQVLLQRLKGVGMRVDGEAGWKGGVPGVDAWWTGNATGSPVVRLKNEQDEVAEQPIWNVYGRIVGVEQTAKKVLIGNHRDAWTFGAADPHSGTAVMLEVARIYGDLLQRGWRPLRTIEFLSWDAEEYNLIGSTEYVENNLEALRADALAYLNLDAAVTGGELHAAGSPVFAKLLSQVMKRVGDPHANASLHDLWQARQGVLETLGAGSDYVAFQDLAGTSSLDLHFDGAAYPRRSNYETFDWMDRHGDPGFVYHGMLAQLVALMVIELADRPVLPLDLAAYASALLLWVKDLIEWVRKEAEAASSSSQKSQPRFQTRDAALDVGVELGPLQFAADVVAAAVREFESWERVWEGQVLSASGWEPTGLGQQRAEYNSRMAQFETDLLDLEVGGGLPNRTQFKHVVFGPRQWDAYAADLFPAVRDAVAARDWPLANATVARVASQLQQAAANLIK